MAIKTAAEIWRRYVTDGIAASGANKPDKTDIIVRGTWVETMIAAASGLGIVVKATRALLFADLVHAADSAAWVYADATAAYNGFYKKSGASGSGSWARITDSFTSIIPLTVTGGTANAIVATAPETPSVPGNKIYLLTPDAPNTTAVTIAVNGQPAVAIKNAFGVALAANSLLEDNAVAMIWSVDHYQLLVSASVDASAILAAAQAAATAAAASAVDASAAAATFTPVYRSVFGYIPDNLHADVRDGTSVTDLTTYLQNAIDDETALEFPSGTYLTGHLEIGDHFRAWRGPGAKLVANGSIAPDAALVKAESHPGPLLLFEDVEAFLDAAIYPSQLGYLVYGGVNVTFRNVIARGWSSIKCELVTGVNVVDCHIPSYIGNGVMLLTCTDTKVHGNRIEWGLGTAETGPAVYCSGGHTHSCEDNYAYKPSLFGFTYNFTNLISIKNNRVRGGYREGVNVTGSTNFAVIGNNIVLEAESIDFGISITGDVANPCTDGVVEGNVIQASAIQGISLALDVSNVLVQGNHILYPNAGGTGPGAAIVLYGSGCTNNTVINNTAFDSLGNMDYIVLENDPGSGSPNNNNIGPNFGTGFVIAAVATSGAATKVWDVDWLTYAPTLAPTTGTFTTGATITRARYKRKGKEIEFSIHATLGNITGGSVALRVPLPAAAATHGGQARGTNVTTGKSLSGSCSGSNCDMKLYDGTFPIASSDVIVIEGTYEAA